MRWSSLALGLFRVGNARHFFGGGDPLEHLLYGTAEQRSHALAHGQGIDLLSAAPLEYPLSHRFRHAQYFVHGGAAAVACLATVAAALAALEEHIGVLIRIEA